MDSVDIILDGETVTVVNVDVKGNNASIFYIDSLGILKEKVKPIENRKLVLGKVV